MTINVCSPRRPRSAARIRHQAREGQRLDYVGPDLERGSIVVMSHKIVLAGAPLVGKSAIYRYIHRQVNLAGCPNSRLRPTATGQSSITTPGESLPDFSAGHQLFSYDADQRKVGHC